MSQRKAEESEIYLAGMGQEWCGKRIRRKKTTCARTPGHEDPCKTAETMEYRISSYGLTQEQFD